MTNFAAALFPLRRMGPVSGTRILAISLLAGAMFWASWLWAGAEPIRHALIASGGTLSLLALSFSIVGLKTGERRPQAREEVLAIIDKDAVPTFLTDEEGEIQARNSAASVRFSGGNDPTLAATLRSIFGNPSAVLYRLQCRARIDGNAREEVVTRRGHIRVSVHLVGGSQFFWRVEDIADRSAMASRAEGLPFPVLTIGRGGTVLFMNDAARSLIGGRIKTLDRLFAHASFRSGEVNRITTVDGTASVVVREQTRSAGRQELYLIPVNESGKTDDQPDFASLPVPMMRLDTTGRVEIVNRLARELLGDNVPDGVTLDQLMMGLGRPIPDWLKEASEGDVPRSEFLRLSRKDKEVFVQVTLSRVVEQGKIGLIALLNDATELKTLEAQFVQSQKMQAVGQLAGGVAHDFNNLLTAISGHCDLLLLRHDQGDQDYGDLVQINQNANRAAALVSQLLAFSRKQTLRPEILDLRDTLSDLIHLLNRLVGEKVTLTLSHDPVLKAVRADKRQLEQVLMNLVVNARDAMPGGGEIRIETELVLLNEPLERDRATLPAGEYVMLKVSDEGTGIPRDRLQKVFEPFYTTKRTGEGTGLGLSTVYGIVKQTGGYIFVDSVVGKGSDFILYFPAFQKEKSAAPLVEELKKPVQSRHGEGVILLVEDEAPVRAFASRALRLRGYSVLEAESAEDALRILDDPDLEVDVFVTDVVMPGLDGPTWVRQALADRPDVRVVFVSGYAEGAFGETEPNVPNSVFLPKPFSLNQLTETVHEQLH